MVKYCTAYNCSEKAAAGVTFHEFPKDENLRKAWVLAIRGDNWAPTNHSVLCSKHFTPDSYETSGWSSRKKLKPDAMPTIFDFSSRVGKNKKERPQRKRAPAFEISSSITCDEETTLAADTNEFADKENVMPPKKMRVPMLHVNYTTTSRSTCDEETTLAADTNEFADTENVMLPKKMRVPMLHVNYTTTSRSTCDEETTLAADTNEFADTENVMPPIGKNRRFFGDFEDDLSRLSKPIQVAKKLLGSKNRTIRCLRQNNKRLRKKVSSLQNIIVNLKQKLLIAAEQAVDTLLSPVPVNCRKLFTQMIESRGRGKTYPPELKCFSLTLDFYSPKAYDYVRATFNNQLPHRRTIQKWYQNINCEPGFTTQALEALKCKVEKAKIQGTRVVCCLMMDEMAIRKQVDCKDGKMVGYVTLEMGMENDETPLAKDVLVFMLTSLNDAWKLPIGFFFTNSLSGDQKASLITRCLKFLHQVDIEVVSLTLDGMYTNLTMCKRLGTDFSNVHEMRTWFQHPVAKDKKIFVFLDPPHMLKLVRNALGTYKLFFDSNSNAIRWQHIEGLVEAQNEEGLHLGTKITKKHLDFQKDKMKVKLASQTLSNSVATALKYLRTTEYSEIFLDSEPTETFVSNINNTFDILNSRNLSSYGFKRGIDEKNKDDIFKEIDRLQFYIKTLKESCGGRNMCEGNRKVGFLGLLISLESVKKLYKYCVSEKALLKYLLVHKNSQDHLEIFFSAVRSKGGHNNNPSAFQFQAIYKRLLLHTEVKGSKYANCIELTQVPTSILTVSSSIIPRAILPIELLLTESNDKVEGLDNVFRLDHDYDEFEITFSKCSEYIKDVIGYIAGFVVRAIKPRVKCPECLVALEQSEHPSLFQYIKQYKKVSDKGLVRASRDVIYLCQIAEKQVRQQVSMGTFKDILLEKLTLQVIQNINRPIFCQLESHDLHEVILGGHIMHLSKLIIFTYLKIRLHHECKLITEKEIQTRVYFHLLLGGSQQGRARSKPWGLWVYRVWAGVSADYGSGIERFRSLCTRKSLSSPIESRTNLEVGRRSLPGSA